MFLQRDQVNRYQRCTLYGLDFRGQDCRRRKSDMGCMHKLSGVYGEIDYFIETRAYRTGPLKQFACVTWFQSDDSKRSAARHLILVHKAISSPFMKAFVRRHRFVPGQQMHAAHLLQRAGAVLCVCSGGARAPQHCIC